MLYRPTGPEPISSGRRLGSIKSQSIFNSQPTDPAPFSPTTINFNFARHLTSTGRLHSAQPADLDAPPGCRGVLDRFRPVPVFLVAGLAGAKALSPEVPSLLHRLAPQHLLPDDASGLGHQILRPPPPTPIVKGLLKQNSPAVLSRTRAAEPVAPGPAAGSGSRGVGARLRGDTRVGPGPALGPAPPDRGFWSRKRTRTVSLLRNDGAILGPP